MDEAEQSRTEQNTQNMQRWKIKNTGVHIIIAALISSLCSYWISLQNGIITFVLLWLLLFFFFFINMTVPLKQGVWATLAR